MSDTESAGSSPDVPPGVARLPMTESERKVLLSLRFKLSGECEKSIFYCTGKLGDLGVHNPRIHWVLTGGGENEVPRASVAQISVGNSDGYAALHETCKPSHFGMGDKAVMDETYRTARDLSSEQFAINFDPIHPDHGVLERISAATLNTVKATRYKLNSYVTGGFFKSHKDTPKAWNHLGTLLFGLPSSFAGGELLLHHGDRTVTIDWGMEAGVSWVFFYSDIEHEILPVTSGHRVTIAYDVYSIPDPTDITTDLSQLGVDVTVLPLYRMFEHDILKNPEFRPQGCRLAFPLIYKYPLPNWDGRVNFSSVLKGEDAILLKSFQDSHLETRLVAVYQTESYDYDEDISNQGKPAWLAKAGSVDEFAPRKENGDVYLTADSFQGIEGDFVEDSASTVLREQLGAKMEPDVIWCMKPSTFVLAGTYIAYGNEPSTTMSYVAAAIIVTIPAVGVGARII